MTIVPCGVGNIILAGVLSAEKFELHCEVAQKLCLPGNLHTTGNFVATVVYIFQGCCNHIHVVVGVCAAADAETQEVVAIKTVLTCHRIAVGKQITDFAATHACLEIQLYGETLCGKLLFRNTVEHLAVSYTHLTLPTN